MNEFGKHIVPNRSIFASDPFGYSALARQMLGMATTSAGFPVDITKPATGDELKNPILWLSQAHALSEADSEFDTDWDSETDSLSEADSEFDTDCDSEIDALNEADSEFETDCD